MEKDILEILEFDKIRDRLAELAPSVLSKKSLNMNLKQMFSVHLQAV